MIEGDVGGQRDQLYQYLRRGRAGQPHHQRQRRHLEQPAVVGLWLEGDAGGLEGGIERRGYRYRGV